MILSGAIIVLEIRDADEGTHPREAAEGQEGQQRHLEAHRHLQVAQQQVGDAGARPVEADHEAGEGVAQLGREGPRGARAQVGVPLGADGVAGRQQEGADAEAEERRAQQEGEDRVPEARQRREAQQAHRDPGLDQVRRQRVADLPVAQVQRRPGPEPVVQLRVPRPQPVPGREDGEYAGGRACELRSNDSGSGGALVSRTVPPRCSRRGGYHPSPRLR